MKKGFTLIELLVVITIISILTVITVAQFQTAQKKANDVARKGDINSMVKALEMYYADYGKFPTSQNSNPADASTYGKMIVNGVTVDWGQQFADNGSPPYVYMKVLPMEKKKDLPRFCYVANAAGTSYGIFAMLENTSDSQCKMVGGVGAYTHCGNGSLHYCYSIVSPNITVSDLDGLAP